VIAYISNIPEFAASFKGRGKEPRLDEVCHPGGLSMSLKTECLYMTNQYLHVYNRGVDRTSIFFRATDYEVFLLPMADFLAGTDLMLLLYFQGRYKIDDVNDDAGLLRLSRYVHFNPVSAGLVRSIFDWKYSSCREYAGTVNSGLVSVKPILDLVGGRDNSLDFLSRYDPSEPESAAGFLVKSQAFSASGMSVT
jgi:hypothetical protein